MTFRFGVGECRDLSTALTREWLNTNGIGGYASSTICGANTRRYHGLLVASSKPPLGRLVLLSKLEETITAPGGQSFELGCNLFPGTVHPRGHEHLKEFRLEPSPVWRYRLDRVTIEKSVALVQGKNTLMVEYRIIDPVPGGVQLQLRPLVAFRDYHATTHENTALDSTIRDEGNEIRIRPYSDLPPLHFQAESYKLKRTGHWYRKFEYPREQERGLDYEEDLFQPFALDFQLTSTNPVQLVVSIEQQRGSKLVTQRPDPDEGITAALRQAADQFFVKRGDQNTILAGYHWFTDWGRDSMIALPGLALETGRADLAKSVLAAFLPWLHKGLIPNRFPDAGEQPEYNSTDATLWFVEAIRAYAAQSGDLDWVRDQAYPALKEIVEWRERGTLYGIRIDPDGLLSGGETGVQLTWMDAKVDGRVITERRGKPVEIQALWYNALRVIARFAARFGDQAFASKCESIANRARDAFEQQFWNEAEDCYFDVVSDNGPDAAIRPNQIFAFSLPDPIGAIDHGRRALQVVERELLTPFGLRTLSPKHPNYRGRYEGGPQSRDEAYHQGTVWPWLLGAYARALFTIHGKDAETQEKSRQLLIPFEAHLHQAGIGQISEIFDGDSPYAPRGCIAQAWSVGELLRLTHEIEN